MIDPCGDGLEYLHRSPASRKRQQKGNPVPGPPCSFEIYIRGPDPPGWSSLRWESKMWSWVLRGLDPNVTANCTRKLQTRPLVKEDALKTWRPQMTDSNKHLVLSPESGPDTRQTGRFTVGRNITWTWIKMTIIGLLDYSRWLLELSPLWAEVYCGWGIGTILEKKKKGNFRLTT
jgi:hypothetical protein